MLIKVKTITKIRILSYWNELLSDKQAKLFCIVHCLSAYFNSALKSVFWKKVFKNGPSKICGRQPLKNLKGYGQVFDVDRLAKTSLLV